MNVAITILLFCFLQSPIIIVKNNGDEIELSDVKFYQSDSLASGDVLSYSYRGQAGNIPLGQIVRISFKGQVKKKRGIPTYRVVLVKKGNTKLEVEMDMVRVTGKKKNGKEESMTLGSVDKISF